MSNNMNPTDQYVCLENGTPRYTTNSPWDIVFYLWGRSAIAHTVLNFEKVLCCICPNLEHVAVFVGVSKMKGVCSMCGEVYCGEQDRVVISE